MGKGVGCVVRACGFWRRALENEEFKKSEEALPRLKECDMEKASRLYKEKAGFGCDGCTQESPWTRRKNEKRNCGDTGKDGARWKMAAACLHNDVFFLIPKNVTSERPIALMPTLIHWWEALRAPEVAKWQQKYRVDWDATDGRNGEVQILSRKRRSRSFGLGPDEGLRAGQYPFCVGLGNALQLPKGRSCECCAYTSVACLRMSGGAAPDHHGHLAMIQVELLADAHRVAGCIEGSHKDVTFAEVEGLCG